MQKFRVGQKVQLVIPKSVTEWNTDPDSLAAAGSIGVITGQPFPVPRRPEFLYYPTDIKGISPGVHLCCVEFILVPIYDGDTPSSWSECAWTPNQNLIPA